MISLRDYLAVVQWAATTEDASGPYNLTLPQPTTNAEFATLWQLPYTAAVSARSRPGSCDGPRRAGGTAHRRRVCDSRATGRDGFVFSDPTVTDLVASALRD